MEQNQQPLVCKTHFTAYIVTLIVGLVIGTFTAGWIIKMNGTIKVTGDNTYEAGWMAAKMRLASSTQFGRLINTQAEVKTLSGVVTAVFGEKIDIKINPLEPLAYPELDNRIVVTTSATEFTRIVQGNREAFEKEMDAFIKSLQTPLKKGEVRATPPTPPRPTEQEAVFADVKVGDTITATAVENIKETKEFTATEIQIN